MRDHQHFEKTILDNGINLYTYKDTFPIACVEIQLPVGSGHAIAANHFLPGSPHFLEHTQLIRSKKYPKAYELDRALGLKAGNSNGATHPKVTSHWIDTPAAEFHFGIDALIDRVFFPIFQEEDIAVERTVVINERNQNKFYPGKSKAGHYYYTKFIKDTFYPLDQIFGSDSDLEALDVPTLQAMHTVISTSNQICALAVGNDSFDYLKERLAALPTRPSNFTYEIAPTIWGKKEFHTVYFDTIAQPRLEVAWLHGQLDYVEYRALCFILQLLINTTQGPLYQEFREEKGWTYSLEGSCLVREYNTVFGLTFPVNTVDQVKYIYQELHDRIVKAVKNQQLVEDEIIRQLGNQVYYYQTAGSIINSASNDLIAHGRILTEADLRLATEKMKDPAWREQILARFFKPEDMGAACFLPDRRSR